MDAFFLFVPLPRDAVPAFEGGVQRKHGGGRACAPPDLTRRVCLSAVSEANEASYAARPQAEPRSEVGVSRPPSQARVSLVTFFGETKKVTARRAGVRETNAGKRSAASQARNAAPHAPVHSQTP
jgi:hypothetical protein